MYVNSVKVKSTGVFTQYRRRVRVRVKVSVKIRVRFRFICVGDSTCSHSLAG